MTQCSRNGSTIFRLPKLTRGHYRNRLENISYSPSATQIPNLFALKIHRYIHWKKNHAKGHILFFQIGIYWREG